MSKYNVLGNISVNNGRVISVEKGNVLRSDIECSKKVCAFSVEVEGAQLPIKALFKGKVAEIVYSAIGGGETIDSVNETNGVIISLNTRVNFSGDIREVRAKEFVVHNIKSLTFTQVSTIEVLNDGETPAN